MFFSISILSLNDKSKEREKDMYKELSIRNSSLNNEFFL